MELTELQCIEAILAGRVHLFERFVEQYGERVHRLVCGVVRDSDMATDITQEVFIKAYTHLSSFNGVSKFSTWLYRLAWNTAVTAASRRSRNPEVIPHSADLRDSQPDIDDDQEFQDQRLELLDRALDSLDVDQRALITLFYMEERSVHEVAAITGMSESNVKVRLHRIRKKLHSLITGYENR